jgi:hypothetical protein
LRGRFTLIEPDKIHVRKTCPHCPRVPGSLNQQYYSLQPGFPRSAGEYRRLPDRSNDGGAKGFHAPDRKKRPRERISENNQVGILDDPLHCADAVRLLLPLLERLGWKRLWVRRGISRGQGVLQSARRIPGLRGTPLNVTCLPDIHDTLTSPGSRAARSLRLPGVPRRFRRRPRSCRSHPWRQSIYCRN